MNKRIIGLLVVVFVASFGFTACERSATGATTTYPTAKSKTSVPVATEPQIMVDILKSTQTAAAKLTPGVGGETIKTSTPAFVFNTPENYSTSTSMFTTTVDENATAEFTATPEFTATAAPTATATTLSYPTPTPGIPATYTIQNGEYPWCIARRFNVDPYELLSLNGLYDNSITPPGTTLAIPTSGATFPWARARIAHPATYTVVAGDSIGSIACAFGDADPNTIYAANGLAVGSIFVVGQVIQIP